MLNETTSIVKQIADSLVSDAEVWDAALYLEVGSDRMEELRRLDSAGGGSKSDNKTDRDITEDYITFGAFTNIAMRFNTVIHAQNIDQIGMIIPDPASNYSKAAIVISQNNELEENEVDYGVVGKTLNIDRAEDRDGLRKIWEGSEAEAVTIDYLDNGEAMVSMMKILKKDGEKNAVLVVNRSIKNMVNTSGRYVIGITIMGLSMVLIATLIIGLYLRSRVVKPVGAITREAERFAGENKKSEQELAETVGGITELRVLAESIDKMEEDTVANMEEIARMSRESERLETELSFAADLQRNVLPDGELLSNRGEFVVAAFMEPAREVGGDFYDFFLIDDTHLVLLIADVSDKGVGAAFFMAVSKTHVRNISRFETWEKGPQPIHDTVIIKHDSVVVREKTLREFKTEKDNDQYYYVYFANAKANLNDRGLITIQQVADRLENDPSLYAVITGYCDNTGSASMNYTLGDKRAANVVDELVAEHGIDTARLYSNGVGKVASHRHSASYGPNRRASIRLVDKATFERLKRELDEQKAKRAEAEGNSADANAGDNVTKKTVPLEESARPEKVNEYKQRTSESITTKTGTTLSKLARKYYNNTYCWVYIYIANKEKIPNPNALTPGVELIIPELTQQEMRITKDQSLVLYGNARQGK